MNDALAFAAFREKVLDDADLARELNMTMDHEAWIALVVQTGARLGFHFIAADVRQIKQQGSLAFLIQWRPGQ